VNRNTEIFTEMARAEDPAKVTAGLSAVELAEFIAWCKGGGADGGFFGECLGTAMIEAALRYAKAYTS
jgi:hypothetical protein